MGERFLKTGIRQIMPELWVHLAAMRLGPCGKLFGNVLQRLKMSLRIAIPPSVVRNDGDTVVEKFDELVGHALGEVDHTFGSVASVHFSK